jgi:hypothetical protein
LPVARVVVCPAHEFGSRQRLFNALAQVLPVEFLPRDSAGEADGEAVIEFTAEDESPPAVGERPRLRFVTQADASARARGELVETRFRDSAMLDPRLRGQSLRDSIADGAPTPRLDGGVQVLAFRDRRPSWLAHIVGGRRYDVVARPLSDLPIRASLREACRSQAGSLVPLIHFLREITGYSDWQRPPLRATFVIDDPNLHWPTYGFVNYQAIAQDARERGYHVTFATIPFDTWFTHGATAARFRRQQSELSLAVHGNDHLHRELERLGSAEEAMRSLGVALARIERLERRGHLPVARVMVPPHGVCPDQVYAPLVATGFEALCREPAWWRERSEALQAIGGWEMSDASYAGLPVLARQSLARDDTVDELLIAAFLDQPMIAFCHSTDLADGYERLAGVAESLNAIGPVRWLSLGDIARSNHMTRIDDRRARVRLFARQARVSVPDTVSDMVVELPETCARTAERRIRYGGRWYELSKTPDGSVSEPILLRPGCPADITREIPPIARVAASGSRRTGAHVMVRRAATEIRDRLEPLAYRSGLAPALRRIEPAARTSRHPLPR